MTGTARAPRVLYVGHTAKLSGGEIALLRLLQGLGSAVRPLVVLAEDGLLVARLREEGIAVHVLPLPVNTRDLRKERLTSPVAALRQAGTVAMYAVRLRRLILEHRIDVVHTNTLKAGFYGTLAARMAGVPSVWHVRDRLSDDYLPAVAIWVTRLALTVLPTRILANSATTAETITTGPLGCRRARLLAPPLHDPLEIDWLQSPQRHRNSTGAFTMAMVGRLSPWKGQHLVVRALAASPATTRLRLIGSAMFGEDEYVDRLRHEVQVLDLTERVDFCGFTDDVFSALQEADLLVHASVVPEPFGQVVIEGLAAGLPVIATRGGGPGEIITDGVDGLLYEAGDVAGLANLIQTVHEDPALREHLIANGRRRALDFAPAVICPPLVELYQQLVS